MLTTWIMSMDWFSDFCCSCAVRTKINIEYEINISYWLTFYYYGAIHRLIYFKTMYRIDYKWILQMDKNHIEQYLKNNFSNTIGTILHFF